MKTYLGIDIGGTKIAGAIVDEAGVVVCRRDIPTKAHLGGPHVLSAALDLAFSLLSLPEGIRVSAIGIGAAGQIDSERGKVVTATDILPGWQGIEIAKAFEERFGLPVAVDNDVNALAAGELRFGAAKGCKTVVFLALGTGVGGALVIEGKTHHGAHWSGGEFGHLLLTMDPNARADAGGMHGTLEAYCSGPGLVQTWRELSQDYDTNITGHEITTLIIEDADSIAAQATKRTGEYLGFGLATIANMIDPEMIVIGGGLASLSDYLLIPARAMLAVHCLPGPSACPIVITALGNNASVIGAASLIMKY